MATYNSDVWRQLCLALLEQKINLKNTGYGLSGPTTGGDSKKSKVQHLTLKGDNIEKELETHGQQLECSQRLESCQDEIQGLFGDQDQAEEEWCGHDSFESVAQTTMTMPELDNPDNTLGLNEPPASPFSNPMCQSDHSGNVDSPSSTTFFFTNCVQPKADNKIRKTGTVPRRFYICLDQKSWSKIKPQKGGNRLKKCWTHVLYEKFIKKKKSLLCTCFQVPTCQTSKQQKEKFSLLSS